MSFFRMEGVCDRISSPTSGLAQSGWVRGRRSWLAASLPAPGHRHEGRGEGKRQAAARATLPALEIIKIVSA
jgi:hypothetical protein